MPALILPTVAQGSNQPQFVLVNAASLGNLGQQLILPAAAAAAGQVIVRGVSLMAEISQIASLPLA